MEEPLPVAVSTIDFHSGIAPHFEKAVVGHCDGVGDAVHESAVAHRPWIEYQDVVFGVVVLHVSGGDEDSLGERLFGQLNRQYREAETKELLSIGINVKVNITQADLP